MSVIITPSEQLEFHRPFTRISKESLFVKNPGSEPIVFKVKTTAPKQYCVRPNAGRVEANSEIEVQIILQPFKEELPLDFKCKDKFLVQTAPIKEAFENLDVSSMWSQIEAEDRASMHQHKIKCVFLGPEEQVEENSSNPEMDVQPTEPITSSTGSLPVNNTITSEKVDSTTTAITATSNNTDSTVPTLNSTKPETAPVVPTRQVKTEYNEKEAELKAALEKIASLEKQLADIKKEEGEVRKRNNNNNNRKLAATVQPLDAVHQHLAALEKPRPIEGYPPQVVAGVAVLVFIFTYLFF